MNILLSPDSFKGTLTSSEVCDIIGIGAQKQNTGL